MGERAARGADHRVEPDAERPGLRRHLLGGQDVAESAERRLPGGGMDHVWPAALVGQRPGAPLSSAASAAASSSPTGNACSVAPSSRSSSRLPEAR